MYTVGRLLTINYTHYIIPIPYLFLTFLYTHSRPSNQFNKKNARWKKFTMFFSLTNYTIKYIIKRKSI